MMKIASVNYMPELGMEDSIFFHQYPTTMDSFTCPLDNFDNQYSFRSESPESDSYFNYETKPNRFPVQNFSPPSSSSSSSSAQLICFDQPSIASQKFHNYNHMGFDTKPLVVEKGPCNNNNNTGYSTLVSQGSYEEDDKVVSNYEERKNHVSRNSIQAQEHVIAERKRREKLTRSFIALSAIVPGLKKMDKASVLGDAIKYMKQLQERVQTLEDEAAKKSEGGSSVFVKRSILLADDDDNSSRNGDSKSLPEIEVRVSGKDVLIKIQCDKHSRRVAMILGELEKHNLIVQSSTFLPFGNNIVDVTIIAQMNKENCVTAKDLLGFLRQALT